MEDSNAKAAVQAAESKWQWYLLRNPFYNATVSLFCYPLPFAVHQDRTNRHQVGKVASAAANGTASVPVIGAVVDMVTAPLLHVGKYYFHTSLS